jgi:hypothetical protein
MLRGGNGRRVEVADPRRCTVKGIKSPVKDIERSWKRLLHNQACEEAQEVVQYCFGHEHELNKVAERVGKSVAWVKQRIRFAASDANECVHQSLAKQMLRSIKGGAQ